MNAAVGWALAVAALATGYAAWGWQGVVLAASVVAFWLLLQFNRAMRVMRSASVHPMGQVDSAVMLHSRLQAGMTLLQVTALTRSLGRRLSEMPERWGWADVGGAAVELEFDRGKLARWSLQRPPQAGDATDVGAAGEP